MTAAVLITGANRGLGFEFARQYVTDGGRVFTACRNPATASELRCLAQDRRGRLNVVAMDVADAESVKNAATQLKDVAIDVLINSAGIAGVPGQKTGNVNGQVLQIRRSRISVVKGARRSRNPQNGYVSRVAPVSPTENRSPSTVEPVSAMPKRKLENSSQRPAP